MSVHLTGNAAFTNNKLSSWIIEPQLSYQKKLFLGRIETMLGTTFQQNRNKGQIISGTGYTSDALLDNIQAAPTKTFPSITDVVYKYNALFSKLFYTLKDRYLINLTARRDE